jgi:hypothetical protein
MSPLLDANTKINKAIEDKHFTAVAVDQAILENAKEQITDGSKRMKENQKKSSDVQRKRQSLSAISSKKVIYVSLYLH